MKTSLSRILQLSLILGLILMVISGCKKDDDDKGTTDLTISMKNTLTARALYNEVNIDLQQMSIHVSTDTSLTTGWFDLETNTGIYDLMDFTQGNDTILAIAPQLEPQTISQIRLKLGQNNTVIEDGETYDLETPSGQTSGIKIAVNAVLEPGIAYVIFLDFDPAQSIVKTGNGKYKLNPVIHATVVQL